MTPKDLTFPIICSSLIHVIVIATLMSFARMPQAGPGRIIDLVNVELVDTFFGGRADTGGAKGSLCNTITDG
jgi:hypothetical protein